MQIKNKYELEEESKKRFIENAFQKHPLSVRKCWCYRPGCQSIRICRSCNMVLSTSLYKPEVKPCTEGPMCKDYEKGDGYCPLAPELTCVMCGDYFCEGHLHFMCFTSIWILIRSKMIKPTYRQIPKTGPCPIFYI